MSINFPNADFTPQLAGYTGQGAFRFWCQKVLPIVYDDSLSYYELLNKVVNYLNNVIADVANVEENIGKLSNSYSLLQSYVNEHMQEIVDVVNEYTEFTTNYFDNLDVQEEINAKLDEMASNGSLSRLITPIITATTPDIVAQWLSAHITPTKPVVDNTLSISGAAADAKVTGRRLTALEVDATNENEVQNLLYMRENALDLSDITPKCRIRTDTGNTSPANTFFSTGYIPVRFGTKVVLNKTYDSFVYGTAFYDADKKFIAGYGSNPSNPIIDVPENSAFMRTIFSEHDTDSASIIITANALVYLNNCITNEDESRKLVYTGRNALNLNDITPKSRIRTDNGTTSDANTFFSTGYIPVRYGSKVVLNKSYDSSAYGTAFYDIEKKFIAGYESVLTNLVIDAPKDSAFVRTNFSESDTDTAEIVITANVLESLSNSIKNEDEARKLLYTGENALDLNDITPKSRITTDNGTTSEANTFFSTGYIPVRYGSKVVLNKSYDSSAYGTAFYDNEKKFIAGFASVPTNLVIDVPENSAFMRTIFSESDTDTASVTITATIFDEIEAENNSIEEVIYSVFDVDWSVLSSTNFPFGWRAGFWKDDGERSNSTNYIMCTAKFSSFDAARPVFSGGLFAKVSLPEGKKTLRVKVFDGTSGEMVANLYPRNGDTFQILKGCYYGIYMSGTESEITQEFVDSVKVSIYYKDTNNKRPYRKVYERFNVEVNLNWPNPSDTTTVNSETEDITSVRGVITLPNNYLPTGNPTPLIMMCHGYNGYVSADYWNGNGPDFIALLNSFKAAGFAVFDVDNTRGDTGGYADWGNLPLMSAYIKAWNYIKENYNVENRVYLYSYSMGTTVALNMLKWYGSEIVTSVQTGCRPFCQIRYEALPDNDIRKKQFAISFGLSTKEETEASDWVAPAWDVQRLKGFNHYENLVTVAETDIINMKTPPVKVLIGGDDTSFQSSAIAYYNALANNGNFVNMRVVSGMNHGDIGYLTDANVREEVVNWFKRFRN